MSGTKAGAQKRKQLYGKDFQSRVARAGGGNPILTAAKTAKVTKQPASAVVNGVKFTVIVEA